MKSLLRIFVSQKTFKNLQKISKSLKSAKNIQYTVSEYR